MNDLAPVSAFHWFPILALEGLPMPRTAFIAYDHMNWVEALEGEHEYDDVTLEAVEKAANEFGYPVFIRTDQSSAKHDGPEAYKVASREGLIDSLMRTVQDNELKFWLTGPTPQYFLVRQWLDLEASFTAFRGHPIAREWRLFASGGKVICSHFYWPESALEDHAEGEGWQGARDQMEADGFPIALKGWAESASEVPGAEAWSVDFACDRAGDWWLIDMAPAESSWHPDHIA